MASRGTSARRAARGAGWRGTACCRSTIDWEHLHELFRVVARRVRPGVDHTGQALLRGVQTTGRVNEGDNIEGGVPEEIPAAITAVRELRLPCGARTSSCRPQHPIALTSTTRPRRTHRRDRDLPALLPLWPHEMQTTSLADHARLLARHAPRPARRAPTRTCRTLDLRSGAALRDCCAPTAPKQPPTCRGVREPAGTLPRRLNALFLAAGAEAHLLGEIRAGARIVRRDHRVVVRQAPLLAVFFRRQVVVGAQVPLQRLELLAVLQADRCGPASPISSPAPSASALRARQERSRLWRGSAQRAFH